MTPHETSYVQVFKNRTKKLLKQTVLLMIKYSGLALFLNVFLSFCSLIIEASHYSTSETQVCRVYFHQATSYGKIKSKVGKTEKHAITLVFEKVTRLVARALVTVRKKK